MKQFNREVSASMVVHANVVSLIGLSVDPSTLVYELMSGGTLQKVLDSDDMRSSLNLHRRVLLSL